ncbi:MLCA synthase, partial [Polypterus senegalus]
MDIGVLCKALLDAVGPQEEAAGRTEGSSCPVPRRFVTGRRDFGLKKGLYPDRKEKDYGLLGRNTSGEGIDSFWKILLEGKNCTVEIPEERFDLKLWYDPDDNVPGKSRTCRASLIDGFNEFDSKLFGITEAEVERMDPQQKLLLECTYRALEDAGIPMEKASGTSTGVFIGLMNRDYEMILNNVASTINHYNGTGTAMSIAANRISYCFNFTGPSFSIDSACSSSLVALHYACHSIKQGDCEMAICGGVSCILEPRIFVSLSKAKMISPEGVSKPFSIKADGYGRGEGCGIVLLKPLEKKGRIYHSSIKRAVEKEVWSHSNHQTTLDVRSFALNTTNPYGLERLQATVLIGSNNKTLSNDSVEIQISKICLHSSDYFPVSLNALRFGETMYWTKYCNENHQLLCLDFSGIVTTVGSNVTSLKPGDHIISCFPVGAASRVLLPESICYKSQKIPFLKDIPCVSYFILAWEILVNVLPTVRPPRQVGIISSFPQSTLCKIITHGANKCGMHTEIITKRNTEQFINSEALIFLNPTEFSSVRNILSVTTASHIVIVCNSDWTLNLLKMPKSDNEHVHIHVVQLMTVFQKTYLTKHSKSIFKWVKSLKLEKSLLDIPTKVLQPDGHNANEVTQNQRLDSYFMAKTIQLVVLQDDFKRISKIPLFTPYKQLFRRDGVYLVTGGLSGLGFETVKFIAQHGGGYIVILSRSAPTPERQADIADLQNQFGATISNICCDVAIPKDVKQAVSTIKHTYPSATIRGIFHSAVVLHDGLIHTLSKSDFEKVMRPKVAGVLNLHNTTRRCQLDYFVCYSSIASFLGNSAQANYAAANSFLDMFCHYRRRIGLPGQSINWGALNIGLLLNKDKIQQFLEQKGLMILDVPEIHECLEYCLMQSNPQIVASKFHFQNLSKHSLSSNVYLKQRFYSVMAEEIKHLADTSEISQGNSISNLENYVITVLCDICGMDAEEVTNDTSLLAFGIDSMLAMTVQNRMFQDRNVNVPLVKLMDPNTTVSMLVSLLQENPQTEGHSEGEDINNNDETD